GIWSSFLPLPAENPVTSLRILNDRLYALAGGKLYRHAGNAWEGVEVAPDAQFAAMVVQYPQTLWLLDIRAEGARLWSSTDAAEWTIIPIRQ
ncbi:MAG: hypothetical protein K8I30_06695, partial [Anaerolineae bacterium]|nr:hypothetical protein [Anaerolineae bacterium]